ncbi:MAG: radical SAM protein [Kosmotogaceae bacterium]|nr:radical SAM protein [Kosmotogaceae bacterium]
MREIIAKTVVSALSGQYSGCRRFTYNPYRGCQHGCIYCDSRSECYGIDDFEDIGYKSNAVELLKVELKRKREKGIISTGSMSDPYTPLEEKMEITKRSLLVIRDLGFGVQITTKSDLLLRDVDVLKDISKKYCSVVFTITTSDDELANKLEPGAPSPSRRIEAVKTLSRAGIDVGIALMPVLPFIEDSTENILQVLTRGKAAGAKFIYPSMGMTLRDRQREYYYLKLDELFPGMSNQYKITYGNSYSCSSLKAKILTDYVRYQARLLNLHLLEFGRPFGQPNLNNQIKLF